MAGQARPRDLVPLPSRRLLSREEAAGYAGISVGFFNKLVEDGRMPRPRVANYRRLWDVRHLDAAIDALPVDGADEPATSSWDDL